MIRSAKIVVVAAGLAWASLGPAGAQTPGQPSYGYQPYNDRNPTGFVHPNNTGYGQYQYQPRATGHRSKALSYRRFRGY